MATVPPEDGPVWRFDRTERLVHWSQAAAFFALAATGAALYFPALATLTGRPGLRVAHEVAGLAAVAVPLLALAGPWGRGLRADVGRIDVFDDDDRRWLAGGWRRDLFRDGGDVPAGKFNAGQKVNAAFAGAATVVLAATGAVMFWHRHFPLWLKEGANLVHDLTAAALVVAVAGHVALALRDRGAMRGMVTGRVPRAWAERHHPRWVPGEGRKWTRNPFPNE